jgi:hypothetical protein
MFKKAFVTRLLYFLIVILALILLVLLVKNDWDVPTTFNSVLGIFN